MKIKRELIDKPRFVGHNVLFKEEGDGDPLEGIEGDDLMGGFSGGGSTDDDSDDDNKDGKEGGNDGGAGGGSDDDKKGSGSDEGGDNSGGDEGGSDGDGDDGDNNDGNDGELSDEQIGALRDNVLDHFKGSEIDDEGNILDDEGKVIATKDQANDYIKSVDPKFLEKSGSNNGGSQTPLIEEIIVKGGYDLKDQEGNPVKYDDSVEGIHKYTEDVATVKAQTKINDFLSSNPRVKEFYDHLNSGAKEEQFFTENKDYGSITLDKDNEEQLSQIYVESQVKKGVSEEEAKENAESAKDQNKLFERAKNGLKDLVDYKKQQDVARQEEIDNAKAAEKEKTKNYWDSVNEVIKKGNLTDIVVPESEREGFFKYMAMSADERGNSQATIKKSKLSLQDQLKIEYLIYKNFDFSSLIKEGVQSQGVDKLRKRLAGRHSGAGDNKGAEGTSQVKLDDISVDNLM